jgi:SPP1 family predicted phage head-tail adaptor
MPPPSVRAGDLRHPIQIVKPTLAQDSAGGWEIDQAGVFANVWAAIEPLTGRELFAAQQKVSEVTHKITIRYTPGVLASMNVWFEDREFQIQAVENPEERNIVLVLLAIERDNSAREQAGQAVILNDSGGNSWQLTVSDSGVLAQVPVAAQAAPAFVLNDAGTNTTSWLLGITILGRLDNPPQTYSASNPTSIVLVSPDGSAWSVEIDTEGDLSTTES